MGRANHQKARNQSVSNAWRIKAFASLPCCMPHAPHPHPHSSFISPQPPSSSFFRCWCLLSIHIHPLLISISDLPSCSLFLNPPPLSSLFLRSSSLILPNLPSSSTHSYLLNFPHSFSFSTHLYSFSPPPFSLLPLLPLIPSSLTPSPPFFSLLLHPPPIKPPSPSPHSPHYPHVDPRIAVNNEKRN